MLGFDSVAGWIFWGSVVLLGYIYIGYPLIAAARARLRPKARIVAAIEPTVSIIVVAHNEGDRIARRIDNLLALDYPADRLEIVVASDGSTDDTVAQARAYRSAGVIVRAFATRRGKAAVLSRAVPTLHGEIVLFADARQRFDRDTLRVLVANFADPTVGGVSGELVLTTRTQGAAVSHGTALYWRCEKFIRSTEGKADSTVGATGAIYAIRRALFEPIPDDTILDDVLVPLRIVRRGYRVLFEPGARAYDDASASARQEFVRKVRTIAGTFQLFARERWLLNPRQNRLWFETISHKAARLILPVLHVLLFASAAALMANPLFAAALLLQIGFYTAALIGYSRRHSRHRAFVFSVPCALCLLYWATIVGFMRFLMKRQQATWERVPASTRLAS
jgi:cellulose synthase/poly-beta-1,6-N-acetylglucosamine synthase-like glycosyltransferase